MARFFRRGTTKIAYLPAIASLDAPTSGEVAAGTDLTGAIADTAGWDFSNTPITTPDLSTTFDTQIGGPDSAGTPTMTFYDDQTTTIRAALAKGTAGFILRQPYGSATTKRAEVFPIKTTAVNDAYTLGNEAAKFIVGFAVTAVPHLAAAMP